VTPNWNARHAGKRAGTKIKSGDYMIEREGKLYSLRKLIWKYHHGTDSTSRIIHKNGNYSDSRIENL